MNRIIGLLFNINRARRLLLRKVLIVSFAMILGAGLWSSTVAQDMTRDFDYEHYPRLDYQIKELKLDLNVQPQPLHLDGVAQYTVSPNIDSLRVLKMHAVRLDIQQVQVRGEESDYVVDMDTLRIELPEPAKRNQALTVSIRYRATPEFGILRDTSGTVWTSRLPRTNAHWLPVIDHPRVTLHARLNYTVPPGYTVISNGSLVGKEVVSVDKKQYKFRTKETIAASDLTFAAGAFVRKKISFGVKTINGYFPRNQLTDPQQQSLLKAAYQKLNRSEEILQREYPYSAFNFVVLRDHKWETKNYAGSVGLMYQNDGTLRAQLNRSIWGQWFGSYQREEQWSDVSGILLHQAWLASRFDDSTDTRIGHDDRLDSVTTKFYDKFGSEQWKRWQQFFDQSGYSVMKHVVSRSVSTLLNESGVYNWNDYARYWYRQSGQPWFDIPRMKKEKRPDTSRYRVRLHYNRSDQKLAFKFEAIRNPLDELITLSLQQIAADTIRSGEVTFTGQEDSVLVNAPDRLQNVHIEHDLDIPLTLEIQKPKEFWIHQLQEGESPADRADAALGLKNYQGEPDLQLLLNQVLKQDTSVEVRAALYNTLAAILQGATGTQETFLTALRSDRPKIQSVALNALRYYEKNPKVMNVIRRFALENHSSKLNGKAIKIYASMADQEEFDSFAKEFASSTSPVPGLSTLLKEWLHHGGSKEPLKVALNFTSNEYPFNVRANMLRLLIEHGEEFQPFLKKIPNLLQDLDPRIRYMTTESLALLDKKSAEETAREGLVDEYDARVVEKLNNFIQ